MLEEKDAKSILFVFLIRKIDH